MDRTRLKQIEKIYHAAVEIAPAEREAFFKVSCGGDDNLRREVVSLLAFENSFDTLIDSPPELLAAEILSELAEQMNLSGK